MTDQLRFPGMDFAADLEESIHVLRENEPPGGYYGCFSGGKDSVVIKHLARVAGVKVDWHYNVTTIDPPELVKFIKREHPDVKWVRSRHGNFFNRAANVKGFPTRRARWCCDEYKETNPPCGGSMLMGIRAQESSARAARWGLVAAHWRANVEVINPIFKWDAGDLWDYIRAENITYCSLYDEGFSRLGCIGCPMAGRAGRAREFARWPKYEKKWRRVFRRVWDRRHGTIQRDGRPWFGDVYFEDWKEMWDWWLSDRSLPDVESGLL